MKVYIYPQLTEKQIMNPYIHNMSKSFAKDFEIVHKEYRFHIPQPLRLLMQTGKADVYVINWIEMSDDRGVEWVRSVLTMVALILLHIKKRKIVWFFHDLHPHNGESFWSLKIRKWLFNKSTMIIAHSKEAEEYAKLYAKCPVYFKNHPIAPRIFKDWDKNLQDCDFYVWGKIVPYKGVVELLSNPLCHSTGRKFLIVGYCADDNLRKQIENLTSENTVFENRSAGFDEIAAQCKKAKYVLFPYVGDSISSSGVLMDTIQMGGTPVGPNRGAFADMDKEGCCITYNNIDEIFKLPVDGKNMHTIKPEAVEKFINENLWDSFSHWFYELLNR